MILAGPYAVMSSAIEPVVRRPYNSAVSRTRKTQRNAKSRPLTIGRHKPMASRKPGEKMPRMKRKDYEKELRKLQVELCHLQQWMKSSGARIIIVFEGRDAAGKGGTIKAITERVSPRVFRVVALPAPSDREKTQMFIQRYIEQFPAGGEVVIFDRSWYNRAGVEYVMGFCTPEQRERFLELCAKIEKYIVDGGIRLIKIWLEVGQDEQERRFLARINYSQARDKMLEKTGTAPAPWHIVASDQKRRARLNCIAHILSLIPYEKLPFDKVELPKRSLKRKYDDQQSMSARKWVPEVF